MARRIQTFKLPADSFKSVPNAALQLINTPQLASKSCYEAGEIRLFGKQSVRIFAREMKKILENCAKDCGPRELVYEREHDAEVLANLLSQLVTSSAIHHL